MIMTVSSLRNDLIDEILMRLGGGAIDIELTPEQINMAINRAFKVYRQKSGNALEESFAILQYAPYVQEYTLPENIVEVRQIFKRGFGRTSSSTNQIDPFSMAYTNIYLLQAGRSGGLATYDLYNQYLETAGRMFGLYTNYTYNPVTHLLRIVAVPQDIEEVLLWCFFKKSDDMLLTDPYASVWLADWSVAECKEMLGQIREKFGSLPGPNGGVTLNGAQMKAEAKEEKVRLHQSIKNLEDGGMPHTWVIG